MRKPQNEILVKLIKCCFEVNRTSWKFQTTYTSKLDMDCTRLFQFSRRRGLRRPSIRLLHRDRRAGRWRNTFIMRVTTHCNGSPLTVATHIWREKAFYTFIFLFFGYDFTPTWSKWVTHLSVIIKYMCTYGLPVNIYPFPSPKRIFPALLISDECLNCDHKGFQKPMGSGPALQGSMEILELQKHTGSPTSGSSD